MAKRATLTAIIGRQRKPIYGGDPTEPDHAAHVNAAKIRCINECEASGAQKPTFEYTVAKLPEPKPEAVETVQTAPAMNPNPEGGE